MTTFTKHHRTVTLRLHICWNFTSSLLFGESIAHLCDRHPLHQDCTLLANAALSKGHANLHEGRRGECVLTATKKQTPLVQLCVFRGIP